MFVFCLFSPWLTLVMKPLNKVFSLPLYQFDFLGIMLQSLVLPVFLFACFSLNINKSCVQEVFSESLILTSK